MLLKTIILLPFLYFLTLIQSSFLPHFSFFGQAFNLVLIFLAFSIFFIPSLSFSSAFWGGIFLDIFSAHFLGFHVLILLAAVFFLKVVFKRYVQISFG